MIDCVSVLTSDRVHGLNLRIECTDAFGKFQHRVLEFVY
jgi:hypothetical protein